VAKKKTPEPESPALAAVRERSDRAREEALVEIEALQKDLAALTRILKGQIRQGDFSPFDIVHGAFEIFRASSFVFQNEELALAMAEETERAKAQDFLHSRGATLLSRPAGWHWISPKNEMHFLGKPGETDKAAARLARLIEPQPKGATRAGEQEGVRAGRAEAAEQEGPAARQDVAAAAPAPSPAGKKQRATAGAGEAKAK